MPNGVVLSVDQAFMDYTGWAVQDIIGKPFSSLAAEPGQIEGCAPGGGMEHTHIATCSGKPAPRLCKRALPGG